MKNPSNSVPAKTLCLMATAFILVRLSFGSAVAQQAGPAPSAARGDSSVTNDMLLARLQKAIDGSPNAKNYGSNFASMAGTAATKGDYLDLERSLMQMKVALSSNQDAVEAIEQLLSRYQAAEAAAAAKRNAELDSIVKELAEKFNAHAATKEYDELLRRVVEMETATGSYRGNSNDMAGAQRLENVRVFVSGWQDYLAASQQGNQQQAARAIAQLVELAARFTAIPRSTLIGIQNIPIADESGAKDELAKEMMDKFTGKVDAEIDAAKVPADLDATLAELGSTRPNNTQSAQSYAMSQRIENMKVFVRRWQDYLGAEQAGRSSDAQMALRDLAVANYDTSFYPRSRILDRMAKAGYTTKKGSKGDGILLDPDSLTLDNISVFAAEVDLLNKYPDYLRDKGETGIGFAASRLNFLNQQVVAGDTRVGMLAMQDFMTVAGQLGGYSEAFSRLYETLACNSLASYVEAPVDLRPSAQEGVGAYVQRLIKGAVARKDWQLAYRAVEARRDLGQIGGSSEEEMTDYEGFHDLVAAIYQDEASQWTEAVTSYISALNSTGRHVPVKEIGDRLARIKREHPAEYEKGRTLPDYPSLVVKLVESEQNALARAHFPFRSELAPDVPAQRPVRVPPTTPFSTTDLQKTLKAAPAK